MCSYARSRIPFGCLKREDILEAKEILSGLLLLVKEKQVALNSNKGADAIMQILKEQSEAANDFYRSAVLQNA